MSTKLVMFEIYCLILIETLSSDDEEFGFVEKK